MAKHTASGWERLPGKSEGRSTRVGHRPYEPSDARLSKQLARTQFLWSIRINAPQVLKGSDDSPFGLAGLPFARYQDIAKQINDWTGYDRLLQDWQQLRLAEQSGFAAPFVPLRKSLLDWAKSWNLDKSEDDWVLDRALRTLHLWATIPQDTARSRWESEQLYQQWRAEYKALTGEEAPPDDRSVHTISIYRDWHWDYGIVGYAEPIAARDRLIQFEHPGWDPLAISKEKAKAAILAEFTTQLSARLDAEERQMEELRSRGEVRYAPEKRQLQHFQWLVEYQVKRRGYSNIAKDLMAQQQTVAKDFKAQRQTIAHGISTACKQIGLELRQPDRPGRPRIRNVPKSMSN